MLGCVCGSNPLLPIVDLFFVVDLFFRCLVFAVPFSGCDLSGFRFALFEVQNVDQRK